MTQVILFHYLCLNHIFNTQTFSFFPFSEKMNFDAVKKKRQELSNRISLHGNLQWQRIYFFYFKRVTLCKINISDFCPREFFLFLHVWLCLLYLLVNLLCGLGIAESHSGHIFEDGHLHSAVASVQQGHQGPRVHRPIQDWGSDTWVHQEKSIK